MVSYSLHFLNQIALRNISLAEVEETLQNPDSVTSEDSLQVYQKQIIKDSKPCLLRIFVNEGKEPPLAVTAYKTSKIKKYGWL